MPEIPQATTSQTVGKHIRRLKEHGPFDIIGDVHGCADELETLLQKLGYKAQTVDDAALMTAGPNYAHPDGRRVIFLGDLVDRGPRIVDVLRIVYNMLHTGNALCVAGNHDDKLRRLLAGNNVSIRHGLEQTVEQIEELPHQERKTFKIRIQNMLEGLPTHIVLDDGRLAVAHAGIRENLQGRESDQTRRFTLYGDINGKRDEYGLPVRLDWAAQYKGKALVVYGHTPVVEPDRADNAINIDTGCIFGGSLTALRYPENELVSVPARQVYCESARPFEPATRRQSSP